LTKKSTGHERETATLPSRRDHGEFSNLESVVARKLGKLKTKFIAASNILPKGEKKYRLAGFTQRVWNTDLIKRE